MTEQETPGGIRLTATLSSQGSGVLGVVAKWAKMPDRRSFELEEVGAFVWACCDGVHTFEAIAKKLRERYRMNRLEAETALAEFLKMLGRRNLIAVAESTPPTGHRKRKGL